LTENEDVDLRLLVRKGRTAAQIAMAFGRTVVGIDARCEKYGITLDQEPVKVLACGCIDVQSSSK
jgi:hypothetical protein